jgi:GNAT superfamily N-acetyltransferase
MSTDDARRRFDEATTAHLYAPLPGGVEVTPCAADEWHAIADPWWRDSARPDLDLTPLMTNDERERIADLDGVLAARLAHRLILRAGGEPIGAYWGIQEPLGRYYMVSSILRPEWRGRGVYRALLANVERTAAAAGFREMGSRHRADNNDVIVPKLRAGWTIAGFEVAPRFGLLVHLRKYLLDGFARAFAYRVDGGHAASLRAAGVKIP